jgi:hypothetical protein
MLQESVRGSDTNDSRSNESNETTEHHFSRLGIGEEVPDRGENSNVSNCEDKPVLQIVISLLSRGIDGTIRGEVRDIVDDKRGVEEVKMEATED